MKIKICGLNPVRDVQLCIDLKVNYLGFIFYEKSKFGKLKKDGTSALPRALRVFEYDSKC